MVQLFETMRYKPKGRGFDFRWRHLNGPGVGLATWQKWVPGIFRGGLKAAGG